MREVYENSDTDFSKLHEQMWKPFIPVPNQDKCIQIELETLTKNLPHPSLEFLHLVKKRLNNLLVQGNLCPRKCPLDIFFNSN